MKKILIFCIVIVLLSGNASAIEFRNTTHTIIVEINDTVFIDNKDVYIECSPHTIYRDSFVYFNFSFKLYTGNADIYLGFTDCTCPVNVSLFIGKNYIKIDKKIEKIDYKHDNKNYWHYIDNIKIQKNNSIQAWIDIKDGVKNGKYDFAIKPTGADMAASITDKNFYILDPYYETYETWYSSECPCDANNTLNTACNNSMFIDIGNKKFLYLQSTYLCGDIKPDGNINFADLLGLRNYISYDRRLLCAPPTINYEILNYNNYVGTDIIRPLKSDIYD